MNQAGLRSESTTTIVRQPVNSQHNLIGVLESIDPPTYNNEPTVDQQDSSGRNLLPPIRGAQQSNDNSQDNNFAPIDANESHNNRH